MEVTKTCYDNGNLKQELTYDNGKLNGVQKEYYENGQLEQMPKGLDIILIPLHPDINNILQELIVKS